MDRQSGLEDDNHSAGDRDRLISSNEYADVNADTRLLGSTQYVNGGAGVSCPANSLQAPPEASLKYKIFKSFLVSNVFTFMGLGSASIAPSIDDLRHQVGCNYEQFTRAYMFSSIGGMFGALIGGTLADRFQKHVDLMMGVELVFAGLARTALPWAPNLATMATLFAVAGALMGAANPTSNAHLLVIWGADASSPMQLLHMGFGLGTVVAPLIVEPFLGRPTNASHNTTAEKVSRWLQLPPTPYTEMGWYSQMEGADDRLFGGIEAAPPSENTTYTASRIYIPFSAIGGFGVFGGILFLLFYFLPSAMARGQRARVKERTTAKQLFNPGECADGRVVYGMVMISLLLIIFVVNTGKDNTVSTLMYAVAVDTALAFSTLQGSLLTTGYYAGYAGGRAVYAVIGFCVPVQILIFSELIGMLGVHITLALIGLDKKLNFWICICMSGFFAGPLIPSAMTWMDRYIEMTALAFASLSVGLALGGFLFNWLSGYIFQYHPTQDLYYVSLGCGVAVTIAIIIGQILGSLHGDRYHKMKQRQLESEQNANVANEIITDAQNDVNGADRDDHGIPGFVENDNGTHNNTENVNSVYSDDKEDF